MDADETGGFGMTLSELHQHLAAAEAEAMHTDTPEAWAHLRDISRQVRETEKTQSSNRS